DYSSLVPPERDFPLSAFRGRQDAASRAIGYGNAAMVFHLVRRSIGDEAFFAALRRLAAERMYASASWDDFARAFSRASGKDLAPLFTGLVNGTGGIELALQDVRRTKEGDAWVVSGKLRQETLEYPVPVVLELAGGVERRLVEAKKGSTPFSFRTVAEPKGLAMDPDSDIFRRLAPEELPPTVNRVKGSRNLLVVRCGSYPGDEATTSLLLQSLGIGAARVVAETEVGRDDLKGTDLLFLGLPRPELFSPSFPAGFGAGRARFSAEGKEYEDASSLLFAVAPHPLEPARVAGIFLPLSAEAGRKGVLKIAHYGKYGYLVFSGGTNVAKGGFPAAAGRSVVRF
ncbi:MAG TPA: M1 family peptidase, partial [Verrucomicrobiae bacterium]|nr:M1 family peptidase [Verrucomicrobiae bacterium]